jgi:hypothetical protein
MNNRFIGYATMRGSRREIKIKRKKEARKKRLPGACHNNLKKREKKGQMTQGRKSSV